MLGHAGIDVEHTREQLFRDGGHGAVITGSSGAELVAPLERGAGELTIVKKRFSAFFQTHLDMVLRR
jgi:nicotinamidase-related amidase